MPSVVLSHNLPTISKRETTMEAFSKLGKSIVTLVILSFLLSTCNGKVAAPTVDIGAIQTAAMVAAIAQATQNAATATPLPTNTPLPTPTLQPIILSGWGDSIVDFVKWKGPAILKVRYESDGFFSIRKYPVDSNIYDDLLVYTKGAYEGTLPLDWSVDWYGFQPTSRFEVTAGGPWELQVLPIENARIARIRDIIEGIGDDVVYIVGEAPDLLKVDASRAKRNFIVQALSGLGLELKISEKAPYTGTVLLDPSTVALAITATGKWSLDIATR